MFLKAVDTGGETKDAAYIVGQLIDCIQEVGADNIIQVVTDSAAVCKAAGRLVEQEFSWIGRRAPHIVWTYSLKMWGSCHGLQRWLQRQRRW
jgi:hypothetical protein